MEIIFIVQSTIQSTHEYPGQQYSLSEVQIFWKWDCRNYKLPSSIWPECILPQPLNFLKITDFLSSVHYHMYNKQRYSWLTQITTSHLISIFQISINFTNGQSYWNYLLKVRSHERGNELITVWDFKPVWKQVLFTWSLISAAFQNNLIFRRTCVGASFRVVFTWYFITRNEIWFLSKWPIWNPHPHWVSNPHVL